MLTVKFSFLFITVLLITQQVSGQQLRSVTTKDEYCKIYNYLEKYNDDGGSDATKIKALGFDPSSFAAYGFNHPELLGGCEDIINLDDIRFDYEVCDVRWNHKTLVVPSLTKNWIKVSIDNLKINDSKRGVVEADVTFENTKALFFELALSMFTEGSGEPQPPAETGLLLYPKETITKHLRFNVSCNDAGVGNGSTVQYIFSRGEYTGSTLEEMLLRLGFVFNAPLLLKPFSVFGLNIGFSNKAVYMSTLDIFWTAATGEWLKRDLIENDLSALGTVLEGCSECADALEPIGGSLTGDFIGTLYTGKIEPQFAVKVLFEFCIRALRNPIYKDLVFEILKKHVGVLAVGGAKVLAQNLTVIVSGGGRILALLPIAWDVWGTRDVKDYQSIEFKPKCCIKN
ncbi:MAG: hypothetical protein KGZ58_07125 [Ignavibacteriales bacterium]|nr:hypothetical protein [Ignavibacteriales bacterium]